MRLGNTEWVSKLPWQWTLKRRSKIDQSDIMVETRLQTRKILGKLVDQEQHRFVPFTRRDRGNQTLTVFDWTELCVSPTRVSSFLHGVIDNLPDLFFFQTACFISK